MGSIVSSVSKAVGDIGKSMGGPIGDLLKGVSDFAQSPLGQMAITAGLAFATGGSSLMASGSLSSVLGGLGAAGGGGVGGSLAGLFGGGGGMDALVGQFAAKFLSDPSSALSGSGLSAVMNLADGQSTGGLADLFKTLTHAQQGQASSDGASQGAMLNYQQLAAMQQAQQYA